jgi:hypothetical protein
VLNPKYGVYNINKDKEFNLKKDIIKI